MAGAQQGWAVHTEEQIAHILRTIDGGSTWSDVTPPLSLPVGDELQVFRLRASAEFIDGYHAWASFAASREGGFDSVWRTMNGGRSWERVPLGRRTFGIDGAMVEAVDPQHRWVVIDTFLGAGSHTGEAFRTLDGGASWERLPREFSYASGVDFIDAQVGWITTDVFAGVSPPWRLFITQDGGLTWEATAPAADLPEPVPGHSQCDFILLHAQSARTGVVLRPDCRTADSEGNPVATSWLDFTDDGGRTWVSYPMPLGEPEFLNAETGWVIAPTELEVSGPPSSWALYHTVDGGRTWEPIRDMDWQGQLSFVDERNGWGVDGEGRLRRTSDGGENWQHVAAHSTESSTPQDLTVTIELPSDPPAITAASADELQLLAELPASDPTSLTIYRNKLYVGNAQGQLLIWLLHDGMNEKPSVWRAHADWIYELAATVNGAHVVTASRDGLIRRWHIFNSEGYWDQSSIHSGEVSAVAMSPDGLAVASGGEDTTVWVQEKFGGQSPQPLFELSGHQAWVWDLAFSRDGSRLASASGDRTVRVWSATTGESHATLRGPISTVSQVEFSPEGAQIAAGTWSGKVWLWDATTYEVQTAFQRHDDWLLGLAYAPTGDLLATSSADGRILLWNPIRQQLISQLIRLDVPLRGLSFDREGRYLAAVADNDSVYVWGIPAR